MRNENLPLIGICKTCKRAAAGRRLVTAVDPADPNIGNKPGFFCHECIAPHGTVPSPTPSIQASTWFPSVHFFTFTTSNGSGVYDSR